MINFDGNSHHILHLSFDHYESKSNVSRILETRMIVFRDQNYPSQHGPIPYVLQPAVKCSRCLLHGYDTTASILPSTIATVHSRNPLHPLDICTEPRCPAFSWIVKTNFFFFSFFLNFYIYIYIWKAGVCWYSFKVSLHLLRCGYAIGAKTRETERGTEIKTSWNIVEFRRGGGREVYVTMQKEEKRGVWD